MSWNGTSADASLDGMELIGEIDTSGRFTKAKWTGGMNDPILV